MKTKHLRFLFTVMAIMLLAPPIAQAVQPPAATPFWQLGFSLPRRIAPPDHPSLDGTLEHTLDVPGEALPGQSRHNPPHKAARFPQTAPSSAPPLPAGLASAVSPRQSDLDPSYKEVDLTHAAPGDTLAYTIHVVNAGDATTAYLWDPIHEVLDFVPGSEWASSGTVSFTNGIIEWLGDVPAGGEVQVGFAATVSHLAPAGQPIVNVGWIYDYGSGLWFDRPATTIGLTPFTGYDNSGKTLVDSCATWECEWFVCADECDMF